MRQRKRNKATKEFLYTIIVGDFYPFKIYKITDAAHQVYFIGTPQGHGGTRIADTEEDLKRQIEAEVPIINDFLRKTR